MGGVRGGDGLGFEHPEANRSPRSVQFRACGIDVTWNGHI